MAPKGASVAVFLCLGEIFAKVKIIRFGELDQYVAPKGASVVVLFCSGKFFSKVEIVGIGSKLSVGFGFKLLACIYNSYGCVFCGGKNQRDVE